MSRTVLFPAGNVMPGVEDAFSGAGYATVHGMTPDGIAAARASGPVAANEAIHTALVASIAGVRAVQGIGFTGHVRIDEAVIDAADELEVIFLGAAGFDRVDLAAASRRGILVVNAPGGNAAGVAEHALALILALGHKIPQADRYAHLNAAELGRAELKQQFPAMTVAVEKVVGILGFGHIGRLLARSATALGMHVVVFDPYLDPAGLPAGAEAVADLDELLARSDYVSLHAPLTPSTTGLIGRAELELMKPSAFLVNTSRGELVDTDALVAALEARSIAGAGLDVTDPEPLPAGHPLFGYDNVVLTPHTGGAAPEMLTRAALSAAASALEILGGGTSRAVVNPDALAAHEARFGSDRG